MAEKAVRAKITLHCSDPRLCRRLRELLEDEGHDVEVVAPTEAAPRPHAQIHVERVYDLRASGIESEFDTEGEFSKE